MGDYEAFKAIILREMNRIHDIFTTHRIIKYPDGRHELGNIWMNDEAKNYYDRLAEILEMYQRFEIPSRVLYKDPPSIGS